MRSVEQKARDMESARVVTFREYAEDGIGDNETAYLRTWNGWHRVDGIRHDWWAVCPDDNGGHGMSYAGHPGELLLVVEREAPLRD